MNEFDRYAADRINSYNDLLSQNGTESEPIYYKDAKIYRQ